ncbi:hypothetical protein ACFY0N_20630 [Streptomyces vinaceus]|uniref:hypothetical protein n=1 Tax=Streptomyces vinaceus TaxID=1960 RepID=UPI003681F813
MNDVSGDGHLTRFVDQQTRTGEGPPALGRRHRATDDEPVVVVRVGPGPGELIAQRAELDTVSRSEWHG